MIGVLKVFAGGLCLCASFALGYCIGAMLVFSDMVQREVYDE